MNHPPVFFCDLWYVMPCVTFCLCRPSQQGSCVNWAQSELFFFLNVYIIIWLYIHILSTFEVRRTKYPDLPWDMMTSWVRTISLSFTSRWEQRGQEPAWSGHGSSSWNWRACDGVDNSLNLQSGGDRLPRLGRLCRITCHLGQLLSRQVTLTLKK